jgi:Ankyrin repeats (many copies)
MSLVVAVHNIEIVKYLVDDDDTAAIHAKDNKGQTALHHACATHKVDSLAFLVQTGGANVNAKDNNGRTALHIACQIGNVNTVKYLVNHPEVDIGARDHEGRSPLHYRYACWTRKADGPYRLQWRLGRLQHCGQHKLPSNKSGPDADPSTRRISAKRIAVTIQLATTATTGEHTKTLFIRSEPCTLFLPKVSSVVTNVVATGLSRSDRPFYRCTHALFRIARCALLHMCVEALAVTRWLVKRADQRQKSTMSTTIATKARANCGDCIDAMMDEETDRWTALKRA